MVNKIIINNLSVKADDKIIIDNLNVEFDFPGITLLKGENGSGKSTLFHSIFNNPNYDIINGSIIYRKNDTEYDLLKLNSTQIAKLNIFLSFQNPVEISGLSLQSFLLAIYKEKYSSQDIDVLEFNKTLNEYCEKLELKKELLNRDLNKNYSGGEKKKVELLQILLLKPDVILLDEIDTGVDVKSIEFFIEKILELKDKGIVLVSHNDLFISKLNINKEVKIIEGKLNI